MVFDGFLINLGAVHAVRSVFCSLWTSLSPACKIMQNIGLLTNYCAKNLRISLPFGACALYAKKVQSNSLIVDSIIVENSKILDDLTATEDFYFKKSIIVETPK